MSHTLPQAQKVGVGIGGDFLGAINVLWKWDRVIPDPRCRGAGRINTRHINHNNFLNLSVFSLSVRDKDLFFVILSFIIFAMINYQASKGQRAMGIQHNVP